jgi:antitoxin (DNA-binding transcriptional repressor) of toxin-antitoxin stability system
MPETKQLDKLTMTGYIISMKTMQVAELKAHFSEVLEEIKKGEEIAVSYGRKKETVAVLVPYKYYRTNRKRKLGLLKGKGTVEFKGDFKITDEEFLKG